ncbi:hypothetical protein BH23GEM10_BH23GEM10_08570 [soil metagenome]
MSARPLVMSAHQAPSHAVRGAVIVAAAAMLFVGCLDFEDPMIPNRSAPAVLQANMRVFDEGAFQVDGSLSPGRDSTGFRRPVQSPFIIAAGNVIEPRTLSPTGTRTYSTIMPIPRRQTLGPFTLQAPNVRDVGQLPEILWHGLQRLDPDTLVVPAGADIVLRMDTADAVSLPPVPLRQWFLDLSTSAGVFRISGNGLPPLRLRIPFEWVPEMDGNLAFVSMIYYQSAQLRSGDNLYIGNVLLDVRLRWVVRFEDEP